MGAGLKSTQSDISPLELLFKNKKAVGAGQVERAAGLANPRPLIMLTLSYISLVDTGNFS